ncbi:hypothetical protein MAR_028463 [Mya arenaria]|uniref:Uncharacterized protein n=1 Tax=Mya arenaria TaxID=6604 RepID=A0ABY7DI69_MYAAR|nr:hypothetical protein MAR_028463 [Mya arenaria]
MGRFVCVSGQLLSEIDLNSRSNWAAAGANGPLPSPGYQDFVSKEELLDLYGECQDSREVVAAQQAYLTKLQTEKLEKSAEYQAVKKIQVKGKKMKYWLTDLLDEKFSEKAHVAVKLTPEQLGHTF